MGGHRKKRQYLNITTLIELFSIHMTSIPPTHLPDTLRNHPDTFQMPIDTAQTPLDIGICYALEDIGIKGNI